MNYELVNYKLPTSGHIVKCYGYKTYCCKEYMDEKPDWHTVHFTLRVNSYRLKKTPPTDPEDTILEEYTVKESWDCLEDGQPAHVIGVTKWRMLCEGENN